MSFTTRVKNEISNNYSNSSANIAELSAIIRNSYLKDENQLEIVTENSTVCKHIYNLFKEIYNLNIKISQKATSFTKNHLYIVELGEEIIDKILKDLGVLDLNNIYNKEVPSYLITC